MDIQEQVIEQQKKLARLYQELIAAQTRVREAEITLGHLVAQMAMSSAEKIRATQAAPKEGV